MSRDEFVHACLNVSVFFNFEVVMFGGIVCYLLEIWRIAFVWEHVIERIVVTVSSSQFIGSCYVGRDLGLVSKMGQSIAAIVFTYDDGNLLFKWSPNAK